MEQIVPLKMLSTWWFNDNIRLRFSRRLLFVLNLQGLFKARLLFFRMPLSKALQPQVFCKINKLVQFLLFDLDKAGVEELQQGLQQVWVDPPHEDDRPEGMWQWVTIASSNEYWTPEKKTQRHYTETLPLAWIILFPQDWFKESGSSCEDNSVTRELSTITGHQSHIRELCLGQVSLELFAKIWTPL